MIQFYYYYLIVILQLQAVADNIQMLKQNLGGGDFDALGEIRRTVLQLAAPSQLVWLSYFLNDMIFGKA